MLTKRSMRSMIQTFMLGFESDTDHFQSHDTIRAAVGYSVCFLSLSPWSIVSLSLSLSLSHAFFSFHTTCSAVWDLEKSPSP